MLSISDLYIYPVKSLGGIRVKKALVTDRGLQHDRRFMLVDEQNKFLTQREFPVMALLRTAIEGNELVVYHKSNIADKIKLPLTPASNGMNAIVSIWDDTCEAQYVSKEADDWFTKQLALKCRLVYMPDTTQRKVEAAYAISEEDITSFSDAYPLLLISQSSLDDLNNRLEEALPMNRFRPNVVIAGAQAYEEDTMEHFIVNGISFLGVKLCARCPVPTTDQESGARGKEPLRTLSKYRFVNNKVMFGQNILCRGEGELKVGDMVEIIKRKPAMLMQQLID
ncbi:MAG: MOSC domain-containing protein [Sphingobacteriales bacterium]|nr:MOSC domain-containing protein [Sphingobacteriales bacterium]